MKSLDEEVSPCKTTASTPCSTTSTAGSLTTADDWYALGVRLCYDQHQKKIITEEEKKEESEEEPNHLQVFHRVARPSSCNGETDRWVTFLPNNPEGSYGFHIVEDALSCGLRQGGKSRSYTDNTEASMASAAETQHESTSSTPSAIEAPCPLPRLYLDYLGVGDSDTPLPSPPGSSSTKQRADLVEALWAHLNITRTVVVSAGDSSLVVMELLQRQRQRLAAGSPFPKILHVLSLNGRYVAKTRHSSQLATITQLLRSDRVGPSLAAKAQKSEFTLSQCLAPYLKSSSRSVRKQVAHIVRRHDGAASLVDMARTVDDHLDDKNRYRWHLPHLLKVFTLDQGITFNLATNTRIGERQVKLVHQQLQDYCLDDCPVIQYRDYCGRAGSTSSFLLDSSLEELEPFIVDIYQLASQQIPLSDNSRMLHRLESSFDFHGEEAEDGEDSWHPNEVEDPSAIEEHLAQAKDDGPSLDTRLHTEIVFDASEIPDDDDWELF